MNLCNELEDRTGKYLARDHGALTEWNATGGVINRILEGQTDNGFSTWCNLKNSYLIYLGSTIYQLLWFTSEDILINLCRRNIFDKKDRLSVIRIWTFPNFYYLTDFKKLLVLFVYLDLFPYHCTAWVIRRMPILFCHACHASSVTTQFSIVARYHGIDFPCDLGIVIVLSCSLVKTLSRFTAKIYFE